MKNRKKIFSSLLAFVMLFSAVTVNAFSFPQIDSPSEEEISLSDDDANQTIASGECGQNGYNLKWVLDRDGVLTISGEGKMADYVLKQKYQPWNSYFDNIKSVVIENGITDIGARAFSYFGTWNCGIYNFPVVSGNNITIVSIPDSVTSIWENAFDSCTSLTSISIPDSVSYIGCYAFANCTSLSGINIPDSVNLIAGDSFYGCYSLSGIHVDENNADYKDIDGVLFNKDINELIQYPIGKPETNYSIPNSVATIGENAFSSCRSLKSVFIPNSVTYIGEHTFDYCSDDLVIKGCKGSYAENYANENDITFVNISAPTDEPTDDPIIEAAPAAEPAAKPTEIKPVVCSDFAGKVTVDFKVDNDGKAELNIENIDPDNSEKIQTAAYVTYFDSRGNITGVDILTSDEQGNYSFNIKNGNYKIMLWDNFKPIINAIKQIQ